MAEIGAEDRIEARKTALVTGGSGMIGAAIARALGSAGFRVAVHYRHGKASADGVVEGIVAAGGEALAVEADLSQRESVAPMFERIEQEPAILRDMVRRGREQVAKLDDADSVAQAYLTVIRGVSNTARVAGRAHRA